MKKKLVWLILSCLMVAALVLASCAPAVIEEEEEVVIEEEEEVVIEEEEEEVLLPPEVPKYGGVLTFGLGGEGNLGFDPSISYEWNCHAVQYTNEELLVGDYAKGPTGSGETRWFGMGFTPQFETGALAESWEFPDPDTITFHIREGVLWQDKPPVNGRELVAEDVAFSITREFETVGSYINATYGGWFKSAEATDKYTVVVKGEDSDMYRTAVVFEYIADTLPIVAPEVIEQYGDMRDWRNVVGTGPFILVDIVEGSSALLKKNPNYWGKDPLHPENQLPYLDAIKMHIIPDTSTMMAALRTAKIDQLYGVSWEQGESLLATNPELKSVRELDYVGWHIFMKSGTEPYDDIRVRRALAMAVDQQTIAEEYYGGNAAVLAWPTSAETPQIYIPLDQLPESTRELFEYHPDKARQLLAEAGYPDGFKAKVVCYTGVADMLSMVQSYWADIGVELEIESKDWGTFVSKRAARDYELFYGFAGALGVEYKLLYVKPEAVYNNSLHDDPYFNERYDKIWAWESIGNQDLRDGAMIEVVTYYLDQAWAVQTPVAYIYSLWWPWVQNYAGVHSVGYNNQAGWAIWVWYDQALKKSMGY